MDRTPGPDAPDPAEALRSASTPALAAPRRSASALAPAQPLPFTRTAWRGPAAAAEKHAASPATAPAPADHRETGRPTASGHRRYGAYTALQWTGIAAVGGFATLVAVFFAVVIARVLRILPPVADFVAAFPGTYAPPPTSPAGFPAWVGATHFLTTFLLLGIIRSGLEVRLAGRPSITLVPRWNRKRRLSLASWLHQGLDILWVANGLVYVVLLAVSGRWTRIVPTSWAVVPDAASALLQYVSLDWPVQDSWLQYNSLQQLAYFAIVFVASPLAIASGLRLSGVWPRRGRLDRLVPRRWAELVHWPVTLFFLAFIVVHVGLVFATGALRNLNHMYADTDAETWTGFWVFAASVVVLAAFWALLRPAVLVPIARLFGEVKGG